MRAQRKNSMQTLPVPPVSVNLNSTSTQTRSIDDLIRFAEPQTQEEDRVLREFAEHHHTNPKLMPFLVSNIRRQVRKYDWVCFDLAWATAYMELRTPGGPEFKLSAQLKAWYVRGILYCNTDLNGCLEVRTRATCNSVFGMAVANQKLDGDYAQRLVWDDGSSLTEPHPALRSTTLPPRKPVQSVSTSALAPQDGVQGGLFEEVA
jgi:hypothetical protein